MGEGLGSGGYGGGSPKAFSAKREEQRRYTFLPTVSGI